MGLGQEAKGGAFQVKYAQRKRIHSAGAARSPGIGLRPNWTEQHYNNKVHHKRNKLAPSARALLLMRTVCCPSSRTLPTTKAGAALPLDFAQAECS